MANRAAPSLGLRPGDAPELRALARATATRPALALRARIVLLAAQGRANAETARLVGVSRQTVVTWRGRYVAGGIPALLDGQRSGRPPRVDAASIILPTLLPPPEHLGVASWTTRRLARHLGLSESTVARAWQRHHLRPAAGVVVATDPSLVAGALPIVGLHRSPGGNALAVVSVPHHGASRTDPVVRHVDRLRAGEFVDFLDAALAQVGPHTPGRVGTRTPAEVHVVVDRPQVREPARVVAWERAHPEIAVHVAPSVESWWGLLEVWSSVPEGAVADRAPFPWRTG